jgi:hypothetical protein
MLIPALSLCKILFCQDSLPPKPNWEISGYLKDLQWVSFDKDFGNAYATNLLHNRVNLKWLPSEKINGRLEIRNRFYFGDAVRMDTSFIKNLRSPDEAVDLSATWLHSNSTVFHSNIDRLWLEYRALKWNLRAGRQRINWGMANTWNPNDIFNVHNFLDFDYEERPGSDAVKLQYLLSDFSHLELAFAGTDRHSISAIKYATNFNGYDMQMLAGIYKNRFTAGLGWAGSIKEVGFKGELQFYSGRDSLPHLNVSAEADYVFENGWYLATGILYSQKGLDDPLKNGNQLYFNPTPRALMPGKWNILTSTAKEFTPIFTGSLNLVYSPGINMIIFFPSLNYNIRTNFDLGFTWQSFFAEAETFRGLSHNAYLRLKLSF